jgi:DNA gyrase/topoisomerase IV subunit B
MDPLHRKLLKLEIVDDKVAGEYVELFMGKEAGPRNEWIKENIDFSTKGDFFVEEVKERGQEINN